MQRVKQWVLKSATPTCGTSIYFWWQCLKYWPILVGIPRLHTYSSVKIIIAKKIIRLIVLLIINMKQKFTYFNQPSSKDLIHFSVGRISYGLICAVIILIDTYILMYTNMKNRYKYSYINTTWNSQPLPTHPRFKQE